MTHPGSLESRCFPARTSANVPSGRPAISAIAITALLSMSGCSTTIDKGVSPINDIGDDLPGQTQVASLDLPVNPQPPEDPAIAISQNCNIDGGLGTTVNSIVDRLTEQKIPYVLASDTDRIGEWRDCSGIFLRFSSALAAACPALESQLAASAGVKAYAPGQANRVEGVTTPGQRSTRTIAQWYHKQGSFTPVVYPSPRDGAAATTPADVEALAEIRDGIKVGTVLWFSRHKPQKNEDIQALFDRHINHMGIVTKIVTDDDTGQLKSYEMFHGHGDAGNPAKTTEKHYWKWPEYYRNSEQYPPLGYWNQYLVGIAPVFSRPAEGTTLSRL